MKIFKKTIIPISILAIFTMGCSGTSKDVKPLNTSIEQIEKSKENQIKSRIKISTGSGYKVYIDRNNELKYICTGKDTSKCNYYSNIKHSYVDGTPEEEVIVINYDGYYPPVYNFTHTVQCGSGSMFGWLAIFNMKPFGIEDHSNKHPKECYSRFTKVQSTQIGNRFIFGLLTFMTPFITAGDMHLNKFDEEEFNDVIYLSNIETFKQELLDAIKIYNVDNGIDVIYLEKDDVKDNLEDKYKRLLLDDSLKDGLIFLEKDTNKLLAIDIFDKYKDENILESISLQIGDILNEVSKNNRYILQYDEILSYIPSEIITPSIPNVKKLYKDEFETKQEFEKRVLESVKLREENIRKIQRNYSLAVLERNIYIDSLQRSYKKYLRNKVINNNSLLKNIKKNIPILSKILFLENTSGYTANDFTYNPEVGKLYFKIHSNNHSFVQNVVSIIPANIAKNIKRNKAFKIIPQIEADKNKLTLKEFKILETSSNQIFDIKYTNINFKAESVSLKIIGMNENIKKEISQYFDKFKQKNISIVDTSNKEIWYIDVVKHINSEIPKWFSNPPNTDKIIAYGLGKTLEEANSKARTELAFMKKAIISSELTLTGKSSNFKSFEEVKQETKQSTNIVLKSNEYILHKQDKKDGIWYVAFEYLKLQK